MNISIEELFKNSFVLTVDQERFDLFKKVFEYHNLPIPKKYEGFQFKYYYDRNKKYNSINPVLNCSYGHASIIKLAQYLDLPFVCIFEDDAYPCYDVRKKLEYYLTDIPDDCECLILGNNGRISIEKYNDKFNILKNSGIGGHAYLIFKNSYLKILNNYNNLSAIADHVITRLKIYCTINNLFIQYSKKESNNNHIGYIWINHSADQIFREFPKIEDLLNSRNLNHTEIQINIDKKIVLCCNIINISHFSNRNNYGQRLQSFSLQKFIRNKFNKNIYLIDHSLFFQNRGKSNCFKDFEQKYLNIYKINSFKNFKSIDLNLCLVGGDQCFRADWDHNSSYYNGTIFENLGLKTKMISYSASEGDYINHSLDDRRKNYIKQLSKFISLSFREKASSEKHQQNAKVLGIESPSTYNIDPVFLQTEEEWLSIAYRPKFIEENQVFDFNYSCAEKPNRIEEKDGIKKYFQFGNNNNQDNVDPREWLWMLKHCRNFSTNSFHGIAFSIIFRKENVSIQNPNDIRIKDLLEVLHVKYQNNKYINLDEVATCIEYERNRSYDYLYEAFSKTIFKKQKYCAYLKDKSLRDKSSSGGVSAILAKQTFDEKGIVYGASLSDGCRKVQTISVDNMDDYYKKIAGSKYNFCFLPKFKDIKEQLDNGYKILFTGCPCQIRALKLYLKKDYQNLTTVDLLCNGYSKPKFLKEFVDKVESENNSKVIDLKFRNVHIFQLKVVFESTTTKVYNDLTTKVFVCNKDNYMEKCKTCNMHTQEHSYADITLGDFWDYSKYKGKIDVEFDPKKGTSVVYVNTLKGQILFDKIVEQLNYKQI